jgi:hypothetical protein
MVVAQKHARSPLSIDLPDPPDPKSPFDDPIIIRNEGGDRGNAPGPSPKDAEAREGEGVWEWDEPRNNRASDASDLPTYAHAQSGHGHSGAFEDDDGDASIEALVARMH